MPTARATRSDAQRNRAAILDAAARLFASTDNVSLADVAEEAGVTRTTLYRHFSDRDALVDALIIHVATGWCPDCWTRSSRCRWPTRSRCSRTPW